MGWSIEAQPDSYLARCLFQWNIKVTLLSWLHAISAGIFHGHFFQMMYRHSKWAYKKLVSENMKWTLTFFVSRNQGTNWKNELMLFHFFHFNCVKPNQMYFYRLHTHAYWRLSKFNNWTMKKRKVKKCFLYLSRFELGLENSN